MLGGHSAWAAFTAASNSVVDVMENVGMSENSSRMATGLLAFASAFFVGNFLGKQITRPSRLCYEIRCTDSGCYDNDVYL